MFRLDVVRIGVEAYMSKPASDHCDIDARCDQGDRCRMSERVRRDVLIGERGRTLTGMVEESNYAGLCEVRTSLRFI